MLARLARRANLEQHACFNVAFLAETAEGLCDLDPIDRVNHGETANRLGGLVALQRADEVPAARPPYSVFLAEKLLYAVFTDVLDTGLDDRVDDFRPVGFGHRDHGHIIGRATNTRTGALDALADVPQIL